eukprot:4705347-Amphidinium_carterae.1
MRVPASRGVSPRVCECVFTFHPPSMLGVGIAANQAIHVYMSINAFQRTTAKIALPAPEAACGPQRLAVAASSFERGSEVRRTLKEFGPKQKT